jgi:hypothetical protein
MSFRMHLGASAGRNVHRARDSWAERDVAQSIALASGIVVKQTRTDELLALRDAWLAKRPLVRTYVHTASGDQRLPELIRFIEGGRIVTENKGRTETDALASALWVLAQDAT